MKKILDSALLLALGALFCQQSQALTISDELKIYGDFRIRLESDFNSQNDSGAERDDRDRLRARARVGFTFSSRDDIEVGVRLRSGSDASHQSPHITLIDFDDNDTGDADFNADKWYFKYKGDTSSFTAGRTGISFWKQNEMFLDDDVTPVGLGYSLNAGGVGFNAGYYTMPVGMQEFAGNLGTLQVTLKSDVGSGSFSGALGYALYNAEMNDGDSAMFQEGNGTRDYRILVASGQLKFDQIKLGLDYYRNNEDYSATDTNAFTAMHRDEDTGFVFSAAHGSTSPQSWLFAYYYLDMEALAVNSSFAQDDWVRFGSAAETRATNIEGHEFRVAYGLAENMNLVFRAYLVDAIELRRASSTAKEDGTRLRLDFNYKF